MLEAEKFPGTAVTWKEVRQNMMMSYPRQPLHIHREIAEFLGKEGVQVVPASHVRYRNDVKTCIPPMRSKNHIWNLAFLGP